MCIVCMTQQLGLLKKLLGSSGVVVERLCDDLHRYRTGLTIWVIWDTRTGKVDHFGNWDAFYSRCIEIYDTIDK